MKIKHRNTLLDTIKGMAIILVIFGHCIQYGGGQYTNYWDNFIFKLIYSFHMPIFIMVSGYLYYHSLKKYSGKELFKRKIISICIPIFTFSIIYFLLKVFIDNIDISTIGLFIKHFIYTFITNLWFLWALLYCFVIVKIVNRFFKDNIFVYCLICILSMFMPNVLNLHLYNYLLPFFIVGYYVNKYNICQKLGKLSKKMLWLILIIIIILYITLLAFYNYDSYIYISKYSILLNGISFEHLIINIYRFAIGIFGCYIFANLARLLKNIKLISYLGTKSLSIYMFSTYLFFYLLPYITKDITGGNILIYTIESISIICICLLFDLFICKNKILKFMFLGQIKEELK